MYNTRGIINLIKPVGITSFQTVKNIKKILNVKKAGHTGTLDLRAAGVLPVCLGKATKVIPYLNEKQKEYIAEIVLGKTTDTLDGEGRVCKETDRWKSLGKNEIVNTVNSFKGQIKQIPPMYSAVHHKGKRLYKIARSGEKVEREARDINIFSIEIFKIELPVIKLKIKCSKGTYIRALARDLGEKLDVGAYLSFLIRTKSGPFHIDDAYTLKEIKNNNNISEHLAPLDFYLEYPSLKLKEEADKKAVNGVYLKKRDFINQRENFKTGSLILVYSSKNEFISINKTVNEDDEIIYKPERVFY